MNARRTPQLGALLDNSAQLGAGSCRNVWRPVTTGERLCLL
jgi:hypothetical protein